MNEYMKVADDLAKANLNLNVGGLSFISYISFF